LPADPQPLLRQLRVPDDVADLIRGLHPDLRRKIRAALDEVLADPSAGKALRNELAGLRSSRVARFRIVYRLAGTVIEVVAIGPRRTIYQETWRRVRAR
jgi:mRNA interferase RelE/StbE